MKNYKILVPDDFNINSALNTGKVSDAVLTSLFLKRGILISGRTKREVRASYFASFFHGYSDYQTISAQHSKSSRTEFTTALSVESALKSSDILSIADSVKAKLEGDAAQKNINEISVDKSGNKTTLKIRYQQYHPDRQMFAQFENKEALIIMEMRGSSIYIEGPANGEVKQWMSTVVQDIESNDNTAKVEAIDLTGITDPIQYWEFFDQLTSTLSGYKRTDVVDVFLRKPKDDGSNEEDESDLYRIDSASYKGKKLHESKDFLEKLKDGFHLYNITWDCIQDQNTVSDKFRLSVKFNSPDGHSEFSFISKGFFKYKEGSYSKSPHPLSSTDNSAFKRLIYDNARTVLDQIRKDIEAKLNNVVSITPDADTELESSDEPSSDTQNPAS